MNRLTLWLLGLGLARCLGELDRDLALARVLQDLEVEGTLPAH